MVSGALTCAFTRTFRELELLAMIAFGWSSSRGLRAIFLSSRTVDRVEGHPVPSWLDLSLGVFGLSNLMVGPKGGPYPGSRGTAPCPGRVGAYGFRSGRAVIRDRAHCALAGIRPLAIGLIRSRPLGWAVSSTAARAPSWHPGVSSQCWTAAVACALLCVSCIMPTAPQHDVRSAQGPENLHEES